MQNTPSVWNGYYWDSTSTHRQGVMITLAPGGMSIQKKSGETVYWMYRDIVRAGSSVSGGPVRLERRGARPEVLIVHDPAFFEEIRRVDPAARIAVARAKDGGWWQAVAAVLVLAALAGSALYFWILPRVGEYLAESIPVRWEKRLGKTVTDQLLLTGDLCEDPHVREQVVGIVRRLARYVRAGYEFEVLVSRDRALNAFAAPGGYIVVNQGLIEGTRSPEELAAVLGHEMTHVTARHGTQAVMRRLSMWALLSFATGDVGAGMIELAGGLTELHYGRQQETEADAGAMALFERARLDPKAMLEAYRLLERESGDMPRAARYLSTHPLLADRIAEIETWARRQTYPVEGFSRSGWPPRSRACPPRE